MRFIPGHFFLLSFPDIAFSIGCSEQKKIASKKRRKVSKEKMALLHWHTTFFFN
jgi:hypothetical protein